MTDQLNVLARKGIIILNWRDVRHPEAGGAEYYAHEIARRWVAEGARVRWVTARAPGLASREIIDGIQIIRRGGRFGVYPAVAWWLLRNARRRDVIIDCQNGIPFFSPIFAPRATPIVQVIHHVHTEQWAMHFSPVVALFGRFLETRVSRWVYRSRPVVAVSPSTRTAVRDKLGLRGPIRIVPNGTDAVLQVPQPRTDSTPRLVVVARAVAHKRLDLLLRALVDTLADCPDLRVDIVGGGNMLSALRRLAVELGIDDYVTFHGRVSIEDRDRLMRRAWLTACTSAGEGWGCTIIEAAAFGVPCAALRVPGVVDSVLPGRTGWLVDDQADFAATLTDAITLLRSPSEREWIGTQCRSWAARFTWERSAELLARAVIDETQRIEDHPRNQRIARSDATTLALFHVDDHSDVRPRVTDEVSIREGLGAALLHGCDDTDAYVVLRRWRVEPVSVELATEEDLLVGPGNAISLAAPTPGGVPSE